MSKIFCPRTAEGGKGREKARFRVVGLTGKDVKIYTKHIRKNELELIAKEAGADIVYLPKHGTGNKDGNM